MKHFLYSFLATLLVAISIPISANAEVGNWYATTKLDFDNSGQKQRYTLGINVNGAQKLITSVNQCDKYAWKLLYGQIGYDPMNQNTDVAVVFDLEEDPSTKSLTDISQKRFRLITEKDGIKCQLSEAYHNSSNNVVAIEKIDDSNPEYRISLMKDAGGIYRVCYTAKSGATNALAINSADSFPVIYTKAPNSTSYIKYVSLYKHYEIDDSNIDRKIGSYASTMGYGYGIVRSHGTTTQANNKFYFSCPPDGSSTTTTIHFETFDGPYASSVKNIYSYSYSKGSTTSSMTYTDSSDKQVKSLKFTYDKTCIGKTATLSIKRSGYEKSATEYVSSKSQEITIEFVSQDQLYWTYKGAKSTGAANTFNATYTRATDAANPTFKLVTSLMGAVRMEANMRDVPTGLALLGDGFTFSNNYTWTFKTADDRVSFSEAAYSEFMNVFGSFPALDLYVAPYKPSYAPINAAMAYTDTYYYSPVDKIYQPSDGTEMYLRMLLVPQFTTYANKEAAVKALGSEPRTGVNDTWLSNEWYTSRNLKGFIPQTKYPDKYQIPVKPAALAVEDWNGAKSTIKITSGHYKLSMIPSEQASSRQYGILPTDPVDVYYFPSFKDLKIGLFERDATTGNAEWKYYPVALDGTVTGPNGSTTHGIDAYKHLTVLPNADYCDVYYKLGGGTNASDVNARSTTNGTIPAGYTKLEPGKYIDLSSATQFSVILSKNGAISPRPFYITVSKTGPEIQSGFSGNEIGNWLPIKQFLPDNPNYKVRYSLIGTGGSPGDTNIGYIQKGSQFNSYAFWLQADLIGGYMGNTYDALAFDLEEDPSTISLPQTDKKYRMTTIINGVKHEITERPDYIAKRLCIDKCNDANPQYRLSFKESGNNRLQAYFTWNDETTTAIEMKASNGVTYLDAAGNNYYQKYVYLAKHHEFVEQEVDIPFSNSYYATTPDLTILSDSYPGSIAQSNGKIFMLCRDTSESVTQQLCFNLKGGYGNSDYSVSMPASGSASMSGATYNSSTSNSVRIYQFTYNNSSIGKTSEFTITRYVQPIGGNEALKAESRKCTIEFISSDKVYITCNGKKIEPTDKITYNTDAIMKPATDVAGVKRGGTLHYFSGTALKEDGMCFANTSQWSVSDEAGKVINMSFVAYNYFQNIFGDMTLRFNLIPNKPELSLSENTMAHHSQDFSIEISQGAFSPGTSTNMYARVLLIPQFDAFASADEAAAGLGDAPNPGIVDSWLDHTWYSGKNLKGYLPEMTWDDANKKYICQINPANMTYIDWSGKKTTGHRLVSGHYKVQIVPSESSGYRQYGIVPSEPVDLYITPSAKDMTMSLCVRDAVGGPFYWKDYPMTNEDLSFEGPKGDDNGEAAYRHARLIPNSDYCELWVESSRHRPAYEDGKIPGQRSAGTVSRKAVAKAAPVNGSLSGFTKVEPDDYVDLSGTTSAQIRLVKNGVTSAPQTILVSKSGDSIITGIESVTADDEAAEAEYFTTSGIRVSEPLQPGIYIERRAGRSRKITIR